MALRIASHRFGDGAGASPFNEPSSSGYILKWEMSGILALGETVNVGSVPTLRPWCVSGDVAFNCVKYRGFRKSFD
jgi:hypothetical protein